MSALLLAVLFVGWLVWLVSVQPRDLRATTRELRATKHDFTPRPPVPGRPE
ncbi:hypothetical protein ACFWIQ_22470 [Kitasatospora sp. NPDC127059]|uniref:hypothetical protein n=1 Tax=unclassified Kitasatospora TaxID=2633591 RepID=UPI003669CFA5